VLFYVIQILDSAYMLVFIWSHLMVNHFSQNLPNAARFSFLNAFYAVNKTILIS